MRTRPRFPVPCGDTFDIGISYLDAAMGDLVAAKLSLVPSVRQWSPPSHALMSALGDDFEWTRGSRHLREVEDRLREIMSPELEGHFDEWRSELHNHVQRAAEVGWLVGIETAVRPAVQA